MRTWWAAMACAAAVFCATGDLLAQPGGGRGGPGGFGGGGFGGPGGGPGGDQNDPLAILRSDVVKQELEIVPDQEEQLRKLGEELREEAAREQRKLQEELNARIAAKLKPKLEQILLPHQVTRLRSIQVSIQGLQALRDPSIAAELKITDDQKAKMEEVTSSLRTKMREMFANREEGGDMRAKFDELRKQVEADTLAVLTADQKAQFEKMKTDGIDPEKLRKEREDRFARFREQGQGNRGRGGNQPRPNEGN